MRFRQWIPCLFLILLSVQFASAQNVTGSITGVVTDPSGAVVAGAKIAAQNVATKVESATTTNADGVYTIRFLPIGSYTVRVDSPGFKTQQVAAFPLEINQTAKIDVHLAVSQGATSTVEVSAEAQPILDSTDATLGNTLTTREIENIPLNGRNFSELTIYQPGAIATDPAGMSGNNAIERNTYNNGTASVNGNRQQGNNYTLEGADNNEPQNNLIAYNPAPDAIAEVRVISSNADASYGNANGGAVVTILKSGTNNFHGSLYDLLQNQNLDANTWANGLSNPVIPKQKYTQNIFGGTIGGPIIRNKLFFFFDYEGIRRHTGGTAQASLLTPAMLNGDFSALLGQGIQLYDTQNGFAPYANNQVTVTNPVAQYLAQHPNLYPAPNATPTDGLIQNNFQGPQHSYVHNNQEDVKIDWTVNQSNSVSGFYSQGKGVDFTSALIPVFFPALNNYPTKIAGLNFVHTFSSTMINNARFGFTRVRWNNGVPSDPSGLFGTNGDQVVGIPFANQTYVGFSGQSISNNASYIGTNANPQVFTDNTFNYYDNLLWLHGKHQFNIGVQATRYQQNYLNAGNVGFNGQFTYSGIFSSNPSATNGPGYGPADFVLDRSSNVQLASPLGNVGNRQWRIAGYFQDDYKVTPRLTLNLGLRYEYDQPWYEQNNKTANVLPDNTVEYAGSVPAGAAPGSIVCPTRACYNANYNQFMPRFGFAYQLSDRFVVRGGYGGTSFFEGYSFNQRLTSSPPFSQAINANAITPTPGNGGTPFNTQTGFNQQYTINNSLYSVWPQNTQPAYIHEYNLTLEYALTQQMTISGSYLGQNGFHLADYRNGNQLTLAQAQAVSANPAGCSGTYSGAQASPYYNLVGECGLILVTESEARMNYNAAQFSLRQRSHYGLEYTVNYTYAKSLTDSSGNYAVANTAYNGSTVQNAYDLHGDWGPSAMDIRNSLNFVGVYDLPFGRGRHFGSSANGAVDSILGGWRVAASGVFYSGFPIIIYGPSYNNANNTFGYNRPNQYRPMKIVNQSVQNWWGTDPSATPCTTSGVDNGICAYGAEGPFMFGDAHNGSERGPAYHEVDMSLFKDFHVWHEQVISFRADLFNAFNIVSYGNPDSNITDSNFGQITSARSSPRQVQLSLRYLF